MRKLLTWIVAALVCVAASGPVYAGWHVAESKHFVIYSDEKPDELRQFAERLERFDQAVRYVRQMRDPDLTDSQRLRIYVLSADNMQFLTGTRMAAGFYRTHVSGSAAFVQRIPSSRRSKGALDTEVIFFHEYAHHLQLQDASVALPSWVTEGFAEFFSTAQVTPDGNVEIGRPANHRARGLFYLKGISLHQMLSSNYRRLNAEQVETLYGKGWLLTHYLAFNPERKGQLERYAEGIQKGMSALDSARASFGDFRTLERELEAYEKGKIGWIVVEARNLSIAPIAVRPLNPGEAAIMDVHIRSQRGVDERTAPRVAAAARKVAAGFPRDPFVQATLAEAEYDAENYAAAEAAADRALAANPNYVHALIYKGRAQLELAKANPDRANWNEVRKWFLRANQLDTESAEPLMLFYQSYLDAGESPTKNAVNGLLYAVALAPQEDGLRLKAVRQLLVEGRLEEAKAYFSPIAFQPHMTSKLRETVGEIMDEIARGNGPSAIALLDKAQDRAKR